MSSKMDYQYDDETGIFYKFYYGNIYLTDLMLSWEYIIKKKAIPQFTKKFILDYRKGVLIAGPDAVKNIAELYTKYDHIFSGSKVALIMEEPDQVIFPILVNEEQSLVKFKPFYTVEAAIEWLDQPGL